MAEEDEERRERPRPPLPPGFSSRPSGYRQPSEEEPKPYAARPPNAPYSSPVTSPPPSEGAEPPWVYQARKTTYAPPTQPSAAPQAQSYQPPQQAAGAQQYGPQTSYAPQQRPTPPPMQPKFQPLQVASPQSPLPLAIAVVALMVAIAGLYMGYTANNKLMAIKTEAHGLAADLKTLGDREITLSAPVKTTTNIDKSILASSIFPDTFNLPLDFVMPVNANLLAIGPNGQPVTFMLKDNITVKTTVPIDTTKLMSGQFITIKETIPVDTTVSTKVKLSTAYSKELGEISGRLERIANS